MGLGQIQQGQGGSHLFFDNTLKGLTEAKREGGIGGGSRRRLCCVCGWGMLAGREKIEGGTDMVTRGEDQGREDTSRTRMLLPSDFDSIGDAIVFLAELAVVSS